MQRVLRLAAPVPVRAVAQRTFVTRDLVRTMHRTPPYLLLHLTPTEARLYRGLGDQLDLLTGHGLPVTGSPADVNGGEHAGRALARVDESLRRARDAHPSPLVLAGPSALLSRFRASSRHLHRLAGTMSGSDAGDPQAMSVVAGQLVDSYLESREQEALATVHSTLAEAPHRVATGSSQCWWMAHHARPLMLVVEEGYSCSGDADGTAGPDLIDELMTTVIRRGGWVAFALVAADVR